MAANEGIIEGQDLLVYVATVAIAHSTTCAMTPTMETRTRATKDTGKFVNRVGGLLDWEVTAEALAMYGTGNYNTLLTAMLTRQPVTVKFAGRDASATPTDDDWTPEEIGDTYYEGQALITNLPLTAPKNADATFSITLSAAGKLEIKTVAA